MASEKPIRITITLPTNAYFLSGIRDFTLSLAKNLTGFSDQWAYRCQAVIDELCNNAIEHGSRPGEEIKIIFISVKEEYIEFVVEDNGSNGHMIAADMNRLVSERTSPTYEQKLGVRGRGLSQIVAGWTDELEYTDVKPKGLRVRVRKYFKNIPKPKTTFATNIAKNFALQ